jgi:hypothetical protein
MTCGKHNVLTSFFYPCDDNTCVLIHIKNVVGDFELGEPLTSSGTGTGTLYALDSINAGLVDAGGTWAEDDVVTGTNSGATCAIDFEEAILATHDREAYRVHWPLTATYDGIILDVTSGGGAPPPIGDPYPQPGARSWMICAVSEMVSADALKEVLTIGVVPSEEPFQQVFTWSDRGKFLVGAATDPKVDTSPLGTTVEGGPTEVSAVIINRETETMQHYQGGVFIGDVALGDFGDYDTEYSLDVGATANNRYEGFAMIIFPDGVPGNVGAWMTEFKANMTGGSVKGDRVLPSRWTYS